MPNPSVPLPDVKTAKEGTLQRSLHPLVPEALCGWSTGFSCPELKRVAYEEHRIACHLAKCPEENTWSLGEGAFPSLGFISGIFLLHCAPEAFH